MTTTPKDNEAVVAGNKKIAEFMGFPSNVEVGSIWDYDRSLDHAEKTQGLIVKSVYNGHVIFEQQMPMRAYGTSYFNGKVFKPCGQTFDSDAPCRPYHTSWGWVMPVVEKIEGMNIDFQINRYSVRLIQWSFFETKEIIYIEIDPMTKIEAVYNAVLDFIDWHTTHQNNKP